MPHLTVPSPKPATTHSSAKTRWYRFYAMFSEEFARKVLEDAALPTGATVLDSWLGVGTSVYAASSLGHRTVGIDINPAMIALARGRCVRRDRALSALIEAKDLVASSKSHSFDLDDPLNAWFSTSAVRIIRSWRNAAAKIGRSRSHAEEGFVITALFEAAWQLARAYRSKNPTWVKVPLRSERVNDRRDVFTQRVLSCGYAKAELCRTSAPEYVPRIELGNSTKLRLDNQSVDFVLTSPPYCTRIDYAVATRMELAILGNGDSALASLRNATMGTSTVRQNATSPQKEWGTTCVAFLARVRDHNSKASRSYYYKMYLQYFDDLYRSICELSRVLRPGGRAVIVVQDSYYKGIHTDLAQIVTEMGNALDWRCYRAEAFRIQRSMRCVNTRSRKYRDDPSSAETVLWFEG